MSGTTVVLFALVGALAGAAHFSLLRRNVELSLGGGPVLAAVLLPLARMTSTVAVLTLASLQGWLALLSCAAGLTCARALVLAKARVRTP